MAERLQFWIRHVDRTDSTQDHLLRLAKKGAPIGTVVVAGEQSKGRGRLGRRWESPAGGLYFSVLLDSRPSPGTVPLVCGLAVCDALEKFGIRAEIKWPNDVMAGNRKLAGILCESKDSFLIAGIGVNLTAAPLESAIAIVELAPAVPPERCLGEILSALAERLERSDTPAEVRARLYRRGERAIHEGREVIIDDVSPSGALVVIDDRGTGAPGKFEITSGEITFGASD